MGYAALAQLAVLPEYRMMTETLAKEMTRKFVRLTANGEQSETDKIKELKQELKRLKIVEVFRTAAEHDGFFGRAQIFVRIKGKNTGNIVEGIQLYTKETFEKDSLEGFHCIEPQWCMPGMYNSTKPLESTFYVPDYWYVMADRVHKSRLLSVISRKVPDILKPAYSFGGLSLSQLAMPYVNNWLRTRNSIGDLIHNFSVMALKTNLESILQGSDGQVLFQRAAVFNNTRDNKGLMLIDKDTEELQNITVPLSGLSELQAQAQEHLASVSHIPLIKLLGISPTGLNASGDEEVRSFYDWIMSVQEAAFSDAFTEILNIIQLNKYGEIDPAIGFIFEPLWQMDDEAMARIRSSDGRSDVDYIGAGVVTPEEVRSKLAASPNSGYDNLDVNAVPEPPEDPADEGDPRNEPEDKTKED